MTLSPAPAAPQSAEPPLVTATGARHLQRWQQTGTYTRSGTPLPDPGTPRPGAEAAYARALLDSAGGQQPALQDLKAALFLPSHGAADHAPVYTLDWSPLLESSLQLGLLARLAYCLAARWNERPASLCPVRASSQTAIRHIEILHAQVVARLMERGGGQLGSVNLTTRPNHHFTYRVSDVRAAALMTADREAAAFFFTDPRPQLALACADLSADEVRALENDHPWYASMHPNASPSAVARLRSADQAILVARHATPAVASALRRGPYRTTTPVLTELNRRPECNAMSEPS